jgi:hypothetical protein
MDFDISQTGCGYLVHALIMVILELAPEHRYSLFPGFGDFCFDALMPILNPYEGKSSVHYGPKHLSRKAARIFWTGTDLEAFPKQQIVI